MTSSRYRMCIIDTQTGDVVEWEPGLAVEIDFIEKCISKVITKGVGFFKTSNHVANDIRAGIEEAIFELKAKVHRR